MQKKKAKSEQKDLIVEKIKEMYSNYGIDISDMGDEEFLRLKEQYASKPGSLDDDLKASEKHKGFLDIIV
jgi:hypothetical protein